MEMGSIICPYAWNGSDVGNGPSGDMQFILLHGVIYVCTVGLRLLQCISINISKLAKQNVTHLKVAVPGQPRLHRQGGGGGDGPDVLVRGRGG